MPDAKSPNILCITLILLTLSFASPCLAKTPFTIGNIFVEKTASDTTEAKALAMKEAEKLAFEKLIKSVVYDSELEKIPALSDDEISSLVKGFEVSDEKLSGDKYQANFTILFLGNNVRKLLSDAGVEFVENKGSPTLVLPLYRAGPDQKTTLWQSSNPWWKAWAKTISGGSAVPLVLPIGDIDDLELLKADDIATADYMAFWDIAQKYGAKNVLIAEAAYDSTAFSGKPSLDLTFHVADKDNPGEIQSWRIDGDYGADETGLFEAGVKEITARIGKKWENQKIDEPATETSAGTPNIIVNIPIAGLNDWLAIKSKMENIKEIEKFEVVTLSPSIATIKLYYGDGLESLTYFLGTGGFNLHKGKDGESWVMEKNG